MQADQSIETIVDLEDPMLMLSTSIAPEIYSHEDDKNTMQLQLAGGVEKHDVPRYLQNNLSAKNA